MVWRLGNRQPQGVDYLSAAAGILGLHLTCPSTYKAFGEIFGRGLRDSGARYSEGQTRHCDFEIQEILRFNRWGLQEDRT
jgi:hypothetical protein